MLSKHDGIVLQKLRELRTNASNPSPDAIEALISQLSNTGYQLAIEIGLLTQQQMQRAKLRQPSKSLAATDNTAFQYHGHANAVSIEQLQGWRKKGWSEKKIQARLRGIGVRHQFTDTLQQHGVTGYGYGECTNSIYQPVLGGKES